LVIELLKTHDWYGNVRELENTILQAIIMSKSDVLEKEQITLNNVQKRVAEIRQQEAVPQFRSMADMEKFHIKRILDEVNWNKLEASHILDITRPTLNAKIEKYSLVRG
jgi:DNA-binding NtrC family response regulator